MRYYGRVQHPEFTDLAVVIGPTIRWTEDDYEDLQRFRPEVLLGYRVLLVTASDAAHRNKLLGLRPMKIIFLDGNYRHREKHEAELDAWLALEYYPWCKVEHWHVHRGRGIWRVTG